MRNLQVIWTELGIGDLGLRTRDSRVGIRKQSVYRPTKRRNSAGFQADEMKQKSFFLKNAGVQAEIFRENVLAGADKNDQKRIKNDPFLQIIRTFLGTFKTVLSSQLSVNSGQGSGIREEGEEAMREKKRQVERKRLDAEMRPFRRAAREKKPTEGLLRAVRQTLGIPVAEITEKMGVDRSVVFGLEASERKGTINFGSMARMAEAMGCVVVYGIVPEGGKTLDALADRRFWESVLGTGSRE